MIRRLISRLRASADGTATIELALVAPLFATMIIGVVDISTAFNRKLVMEQAAQRGIEKIMQTTTDKTVDETVVDEAAAAAGVPKEKVTLEYWLECNGTRKANYSDDCNTGEIESRYLTLAITDTFEPMFPLERLGINKQAFTITVRSGIRTR